MSIKSTLSRRQFLGTAGAAIGASCLMGPLGYATRASEKHLKLYNTHTSEWFKGPYVIEGKLVKESIAELNRFLRDWRSNAQIDMDPQLFDLMHAAQTHFDASKPFEIISAYRCKKTNSLLRAQGNRVAKNSFHLSGEAIDFSIPKTRMIDVRNFLYTQPAKGVGYYPSAGFVHIDVGNRPHLKNRQGRW
jgi:uncharacterized protein YcbK (DUF882 family)